METTLVGRQDKTGAPTGAGDLRLERRADGRVWAIQGTTERAVWVRRSFPWSEPGRFLSLRDDEEKEFALVGDPADLDHLAEPQALDKHSRALLWAFGD